jgi:glycosyltransferase involved in cell wall biosynthesis
MLAACPFPANHGTPGSIREMAEAVSELGHEVHVVAYHIGEDIPVKHFRLHRITPLTGETGVVVGPTVRRPLYDLQMVFKAIEVIREHGADLIHAHGYEAALVAGLCRLATGLPVVYSGHNTMGDELPSYNFIRPHWVAVGLSKLLDSFVPRIGTKCLPHSVNIEQFFHKMGLRGRTEPVINFGIDTDTMAGGDGAAVRRRYGLGDGPVVLYAGVMDEFQRLDLLLEAMAVVGQSVADAKLLVVVTIPKEAHLARIRRQAEELKVTDRLVFTDPQPLGAVRDCLAACDIAVVPRPRAPGFPIKLLNYMAASKPCVLYASSASRGLVHGENAFLVTPDTGPALGEAILELLRDKDLRTRLARNGNEFVREHHDRRAIARHVCATYLRTLAAVGRSPRGARRPLGPPEVSHVEWPAAEAGHAGNGVHERHSPEEVEVDARA